MRAAGVEALLVTHLPNLRYLTGYSGTAGAAILSADRCVLIVDFRYATAARELLASRPAGDVDLEIVDRGYDEAIVDVLRRTKVQRIGIEAASMTVKRFNWLSATLAATPAVNGSQALVPTERVIEPRRAVKDAWEVATLREAARRLSAVARGAAAFAAEGRTEQAVAADIDAAIRAAGFERPAFETIVASGPNSARPHARPGDRRLQAGDGVVLDFGGVYDGYCVDLTRTVHLGVPAPALRRLAAGGTGGSCGGARGGAAWRAAEPD